MPRRYYGGSSYWPNLASSQARKPRDVVGSGRPKWLEEDDQQNTVSIYLAAGVASEFGGLLLGVEIRLINASFGPAEGATLLGTNAWYEEDGSLTIKRRASDPASGKWTWQVALRLEARHTVEIRDHKGRTVRNPTICLRCKSFSGQVLRPAAAGYDLRTGLTTQPDPFIRYQCSSCGRGWPGGMTKEARWNKRR